MSAEIISFEDVARWDIPAERVIEDAIDANLDKVVILGYTQDGDEYFASSIADGGSVVWLMEMAKKQLLEEGDFSEE